MASQTERLEREAEQTRADLSNTLDELRSRMSAGQIVDQVLDYTREGDAAALVGNLRRQVVQNPLALGLIGVGLGWLMMPGRGANGAAAVQGHAGGHGASAWDTLGKAGRQTTGRVAAAGRQLADSTGSAMDSVSEGYGTLADTAGGAVTQVKDSVSSFGRNVAQTTGSARQTFMDACRNQPLILAGLGLAIGAAIGASLPRSESEDRLMGAASDDVKERAQAFAGEKMEQAKETAQDTAADTETAAMDFGEAEGESSAGAPSIIPLPDGTSPQQAQAANWKSARGGR